MYNVTLINKNDGSVDGHRGDCADIQRRSAKTSWNFDTTSKYAAKAEYNAEFDELLEGWHEINWLPCASHVPVIDPTMENATMENATMEELSGSIDDLNRKFGKETTPAAPMITTKVGAKWTYIYSDGQLIAEVRTDSSAVVIAALTNPIYYTN